MISEMSFLERIVYLLQNYGMSFLQGAALRWPSLSSPPL